MKTLVLFDFDGTITAKDSLFDFIKYAVGSQVYYRGLLQLSPTFIALALKRIPNYIAKEKVLTHYFEHWEVSKFEKIATQYALQNIDKITRSKAIEKIHWHQAQGHTIVIVSASIECWLKAWCDKHNIILISTKLEKLDKKITGKLATKNCHGIEKVNRIKEKYDLEKYTNIYAYGDSSGDTEMLTLANKSFYKPFRK